MQLLLLLLFIFYFFTVLCIFCFMNKMASLILANIKSSNIVDILKSLQEIKIKYYAKLLHSFP